MADAMKRARMGVALIAIAGLACFAFPAAAANADRLLGGAKGTVTTDTGQPLRRTFSQTISFRNG